MRPITASEKARAVVGRLSGGSNPRVSSADPLDARSSRIDPSRSAQNIAVYPA